jgi:hypothetical protein
MAINKVEYGGNTLIDITDTTATSGDVLSGKTLYTADGNRAVGTLAVGNAKIYYGTSSTGASTQAKTVTCSGYTLETGAIIFVKFTNGNTYNGTATLNVNSTTAKDIATVGTTTTSRYYWKAGEVVGFVYDGTNYVMIEQGNATTTYYGVTKLSSSTSSTSEVLSATPKAVKTAYDLANGSVSSLETGTGLANANGTVLVNHNNGNQEAVAVKGLNDSAYKAVDSSISDSSTSTNLPTSQAVASFVEGKGYSTFSGDYDDLTNKPTIPTVNNAKITIGKNGSKVDEFTVNASTNKVIDIPVPTDTSDLTNGANFITSSYHDSSKQDTLTSGTNIKTVNGTTLLGSGDLSTGESYSTSEVKTKNTWIDGKPIYRKVIDLGTLPNNTTKSVNTGLTHSQIRLVSLTGACYTSDGSYQASFGDMYSRLSLSSNKVNITTTINFGSYTGYAILEYTKTTD